MASNRPQSELTAYPEIRDFNQGFVYLFVIDILRLTAGNERFPSYEAREPGYGRSWLNAYCHAFQTKLTDRTLDHETILGIFAVASAHDKERTRGYKKGPNHYRMCVERDTIATPQPIFDGFWQFVKRWIVNEPRSIHRVIIKSESSNDAYGLFSTKGMVYLYTQISGSRRPNTIFELDNERQRKHIEGLLLDSSFECYFDCVDEELALSVGYPNIESAVVEVMQQCFDSYKIVISKAKTKRDIIVAIAKHIQEMYQIHPKEDRNCRVLYIAMNRLLHEEGLSLCLLHDPNIMGGMTISLFADIIEEGQRIFYDILQQRMPTYSSPIISPKMIFHYPITAYNIPELKAEVQNFLTHVVQPNIAKVSLGEKSILKLSKNIRTTLESTTLSIDGIKQDPDEIRKGFSLSVMYGCLSELERDQPLTGLHDQIRILVSENVGKLWKRSNKPDRLQEISLILGLIVLFQRGLSLDELGQSVSKYTLLFMPRDFIINQRLPSESKEAKGNQSIMEALISEYATLKKPKKFPDIALKTAEKAKELEELTANKIEKTEKTFKFFAREKGCRKDKEFRYVDRSSFEI